MVLDVFRTPACYGYNDWGSFDPTRNPRLQRGLGGDIPPLPGSPCPEVRVSQVKSAADMIAIADATTDKDWDWNIDPRDPKQWPGKIHNKGANVLFCDGHVEWHSQKELVTMRVGGAPSLMNARWNNNNQPNPAAAP